MIGATDIVRMTNRLNDAKENYSEAEDQIMKLLTCKGVGVREICEKAYVALEDAINDLHSVMAEMEEELEEE